MHVWDLRANRSVRHFFSTTVRGEAVSISPDGRTACTGSIRTRSPLQLWDIASGQFVSDVRGLGMYNDGKVFARKFTSDCHDSIGRLFKHRGKASPSGALDVTFDEAENDYEFWEAWEAEEARDYLSLDWTHSRQRALDGVQSDSDESIRQRASESRESMRVGGSALR